MTTRAESAQLKTSRRVTHVLALIASLAVGSSAQAWEANYIVASGEGVCSLASRNDDGAVIVFLITKKPEGMIGVSINKKGWKFTKDKLYPNIKLGTEDGHFGPINAEGSGDGFVTSIPKSSFNDFIEHGATDTANLIVSDGDTVLAAFPLKDIHSKYAELIACDTARFRSSAALPKDPFKP